MPFLLLMPSYNQARYIGEAVRSVLAQTDRDWELWIVDNSTDDTPQVMRQFDDPRLHFHHIPQRMDPGSCLNWMLERARGDAFSYVHTDNNLHPEYVAEMRRALAGRPRGLAYCDMRVIDADGVPDHLHLRGPFDLARLFSIDTLGAPFSATTALARDVGGFSSNDLADDVRFCVSAYGLAEYVHIRRPLLDYRLHDLSRTETGGQANVKLSFLKLFRNVRPQLVARGHDPLPVIARAVAERFEDLEWLVEHQWYRYYAKVLPAWWTEGPIAENLLRTGFLRMPGFSGRWSKAPLRAKGWPWSIAAAVALRLWHRHKVWHVGDRIRHSLLPWAYLTTDGQPQVFRVARSDFRSLVTARLLEEGLQWQPRVTPGGDFPDWLGWPAATGTEPVLHFRDVPALEPG